MIEKEKLEEYAKKLMFVMKNEEYETLQDEFEIIIKKMDLIGEIPNISSAEAMFFPFINSDAKLREDDDSIEGNSLTINEVLANTNYVVDDQVKVPKVVE